MASADSRSWRPSLPAQRNARGDATGAQGGDDAGDERDYLQGGSDAANDQRVGGADDEKLVGDPPCQCDLRQLPLCNY